MLDRTPPLSPLLNFSSPDPLSERPSRVTSSMIKFSFDQRRSSFSAQPCVKQLIFIIPRLTFRERASFVVRPVLAPLRNQYPKWSVQARRPPPWKADISITQLPPEPSTFPIAERPALACTLASRCLFSNPLTPSAHTPIASVQRSYPRVVHDEFAKGSKLRDATR
jgi:hypothetical protein